MNLLYSILLVLLSGCQINYLLKSGYHQALLIKRQQPIEKFIQESEELNPEEKEKLKLVQKAKAFAEGELGLEKSSNYTTFVKLDRPFVSYIVHVAYPYELKYRYWSFPIVGKVPYKGFFSPEDAKKEALKFSSEGFDTFTRGVRAYSTLGWFRDPVLSSMLSYEKDDLVNLIIHETVHTTLYIKSSADFNEQLATFIGNKGTELFYTKTEGVNSEKLKRIKMKNDDEDIFSEFISAEVKSLEQWYKERKGKVGAKEKEERLLAIQERFQKLKFKTKSYEFFGKMDLNNAILLGFKTYVNDLSKFEKVYARHESLKSFVQEMKTLESSKDPNKDLLMLTKD